LLLYTWVLALIVKAGLKTIKNANWSELQRDKLNSVPLFTNIKDYTHVKGRAGY
jgi:hypothetical protein